MPFDTLHAKIKCPICKGTRIYDHGFNSPQEPFKWKRCPYCDTHGETYIEATFEVVADYIDSLSDDKKQEILSRLSIKQKAP